MVAFQNLFGLNPSDVQNTCVLTPFLHKGMLADLGINNLVKGKPFSSGQSNNFTFIYTQTGAPNIGDAVLYLKDTPCTKLIFIGACGLVEKNDQLDIGSIVRIKESYAYESFCYLLNEQYGKPPSFQADIELSENFSKKEISKVNCASFGSLKLEENYITQLNNQNISVIDMESAAFLCAASYIKRPAAALLYVTDILKYRHVFEDKSAEEQSKINKAQKNLYALIKSCTA